VPLSLHPRRPLPPPRRSGLRIHPSLRSAVICSARRPRSRRGIPDRLRRSGGRRRFALSAAREPRCAPLETRSARAFVRSACARLHPRPGNGGDAVPVNPSAASRCSRSLATLSVCLGSAAPTQDRSAAPQTILPHPSASTACRRPSLRSDAGSTMAATRANACHRPSIHRGSRLVFCRQLPLPGEAATA
jgi:hypothetical protein